MIVALPSNSPRFLDGNVVAFEELGKAVDLLAEGGHVMGTGRAIIQIILSMH
ncbi:MAG: hypothetical protein LLG97_07230 [Deltaproteobacteria bacterium]|nr:hypothetical protein [Deltaproteobacteria bacterium]